MTDMKKLRVGSIKADTSLAGLYFDDNCFNGIPKDLRVSQNDFQTMPQFEWNEQENKSQAISNTLGSVTLTGYNETLLEQVLAMDNDDLKDQFLANMKEIDVHVDMPDVDTPEYQALKAKVDKIQQEFENSKNEGKDLVIKGVVCHMAPIALRGKGNFNKFQGIQLKLYNFNDAKYEFKEPVK